MNNYQDVIYTGINQRRKELLRLRRMKEKAIERFQREIDRIDEELRQINREME